MIVFDLGCDILQILVHGRVIDSQAEHDVFSGRIVGPLSVEGELRLPLINAAELDELLVDLFVDELLCWLDCLNFYRV